MYHNEVIGEDRTMGDGVSGKGREGRGGEGREGHQGVSVWCSVAGVWLVCGWCGAGVWLRCSLSMPPFRNMT